MTDEERNKKFSEIVGETMEGIRRYKCRDLNFDRYGSIDDEIMEGREEIRTAVMAMIALDLYEAERKAAVAERALKELKKREKSVCIGAEWKAVVTDEDIDEVFGICNPEGEAKNDRTQND